MIPVITVDGPSASGKSTVGRMLANALNWHFLDSGSIYRLLALSASMHRVDAQDAKAVCSLAEHLDVVFNDDALTGKTDVRLDGRTVTNDIRTEECGHIASQIATHPQVREALLMRQRQFLQPPGLVADGRDMGTVVFPDAPLKIFITASIEARARRRFVQLETQSAPVDFDALFSEMIERDTRDRSRLVSPLVPAKDAITIDTDAFTAQEVLAQILERWQSLNI